MGLRWRNDGFGRMDLVVLGRLLCAGDVAGGLGG
jgi:hypothetical protein